ncbi:MAG: hypothetical protein U1E67_04995 [Hyphomicrobiales bacterium]
MSGFGAMLLLALLSHGGLAVTVNIDVVSKGEPVPSTEISFETADGSAVNLETPNATTAELVAEDEPAAQPPSDSSADRPTDASQTPTPDEPAASSESTEASKAQPGETTTQEGSQTQPTAPEKNKQSNIQTIALPDEFVGKTLTMIIKKDGEVIKRQSLLIEPKEQQVPVEAFDASDAKISLAVTQAKSCRAGKDCDLQVDAKNEGAGIYKGPLFLAALVPGGLSAVGKGTDALACGLSSAGQHLCQATVSLEPGETQRWTMRLSLPQKLPRNTEACVGVAMPDPAKEEGSGSLIQAVQLGLQQKKLLSGRADGRLGSKTKAAIVEYTKTTEAQPDFPQLYKTLYNQDARDAIQLGLGKARSCQALKITPEPVAKKAVVPSAKAKTVANQTPKSQKKKKQAKSTKQQYDDDDDDGNFNPVGVGISIGLGSGGGSGKDRYRKKKKYEDVPID